MLIALFTLVVAAQLQPVGFAPVTFPALASTACRYDREVGRYECVDVDSVAVIVDAATGVVPDGVTFTARLRAGPRCLLPGVDIEIAAAGADSVVVAGEDVAFGVDVRGTTPVFRRDGAVVPAQPWAVTSSSPLRLTIDDDDKGPCWRARDVAVAVPVSINGVTSTITWHADVRRDPHAARVAAAHTPEPKLPTTSTPPVVPEGYAGVVPGPDQTPRIIAAVVGGVVGVGAGIGLVAVLNRAQPDLFNGAVPAAVLAVVVLGGAGAGLGSVLVGPSEDPRTEAFARYALEQQRYDDATDGNDAVIRQHTAWVELQARSAQD